MKSCKIFLITIFFIILQTSLAYEPIEGHPLFSQSDDNRIYCEYVKLMEKNHCSSKKMAKKSFRYAWSAGGTQKLPDDLKSTHESKVTKAKMIPIYGK